MPKHRWLVPLSAVALLAGSALWSGVNAQGVTTGAIGGTVQTEQGAGVEGAQIQVVNKSTGATTGAISRTDGTYRVQGLEVGGPYTVTVRRIGFSLSSKDNVQVQLGQTTRVDFQIATQATQLSAIAVTAASENAQISPTKMGTGATISDTALARFPTLNRNFVDIVQTVPQVSTTTGYISGGGVNVRQNAIQIDGAQAGDQFGLGTTGQPGSQANAKSIPLDAVKEYQVLLSPFDVRQGGFGGLLINAVTKSGTNQMHGTVYGYTRNQSLTRTQPYLLDYSQQQYGLSVGGPVVRDKAFFFLNGEWQKLQTPATGPFIGSTSPKSPIAQTAIDQFNTIAQGYGLTDPGSGGQVQKHNPTRNVFGRVDGYLPGNTHVILRHNYASADNTVFSRSNPQTTAAPNFNLTSNLYLFSNKTNSTVAEFLTTLPSGIFNEFLANRTTISDFRTVPVRFPQITVQGIARSDTNLTNARIVAGTEASSQGNTLDQRTYEFTDNFTVPVKSHNITIGAKALFYKPINLFAQNSLGSWTFSSLANFQAGIASSYSVSAPAPTDPANGLATFHANNYTAYIQDQWTITPTFNVTAGVRYDKPDFRDAPPENASVFTEYARHTSSVPSRANVAPRLGFNWDITGDGNNQLRGGFGYFTGSVPFVYLSNAFGNSGLSGFAALTCNGSTTGVTSLATPTFNAQTIASPPTSCAAAAGKAGATVALGGSINTVDPSFHFPLYQKATLGYDRRLPFDIIGTLEGLYTHSVYNVFYQNLALVGPQGTDPHGRVMYGNLIAGGAAAVYKGSRTTVLDASNSSGDFIYSITSQLQRTFANNFEGTLSYTYQHAKDVTTTTSSTAGSNYRYQRSVSGDILAKNLSRSKNDQPHRVIAAGTYSVRKTYTDISVIYTGNSGAPFDYVYGSNGGTTGDLNADGQTQNDLIYVPTSATDANQILFQGYNSTNATTKAAAAAQAAAFDKYIDSLDCLRNARGTIMTRNSCRNPWINEWDVSIGQSLPRFRGQTLQLRLDVVNFGNLLNKNWGAQAFSDQGSTCGQLCGSTVLLVHTGNALPTGTPSTGTTQAIPIVTFDPNLSPFSANNASSNYRMQLSLRYSF